MRVGKTVTNDLLKGPTHRLTTLETADFGDGFAGRPNLSAALAVTILAVAKTTPPALPG